MSSSRDGRRAFNAELPVEVLDAVKEESEKTGKPMWEILNDSARMFLGLDEVSTEASVKRHIERLEDEVDDLQTQKEEIVAELSTKQNRLEDYREKLDEIQSQKESYESRLDSILDELEQHTNRKVIAFRSEIKELATDRHGQPTPDNREAVKEDLWERAMDQQRDVAPYQFNESTSQSQSVAATDGGTTDEPNSNLSSVQKLRNEKPDDSDDDDDDQEIVTDGGSVSDSRSEMSERHISACDQMDFDDSDDDDDDEQIMTDGGVATQTNPELVEHAMDFLRTYCKDDIGSLATLDERSLVIDWTDVYQWDKDVAEDILDNEPQIRAHFEAALQDYDIPADISLDNKLVRFTNLGETQQQHCDELRADQIGAYWELKGQVKQRTGAKPVPTEAVFECQRCGTPNPIPQEDAKQEPHECQGCERQGPFTLDYSASTFKDQERLRIQEPPERTQGADGRSVDVVVDHDLVDSCNPGDRIRVAGQIDAVEPSDGEQFDYEINGRAIEHTQETYEEIELDQQTIDEIKHVARNRDADPFETLKNSVAPGHHGDDHIKLSIALQLFGGVRGELPDGSRERGDPHVLLMGDPGVGKSTLLEAAEEIAPRSASASGKGASKAGLTAAALPSDFADNGMTLEAGALVLADKGLAAIDEIDKIPDEVSSAMHGAMSKQRVEVNKGGFSNVSLPSRTAVLAAGNPKFGRFDPYEPIGEQLELPGALMDRFDLIWTMKDTPEPERDEAITDHILNTVDVATQNVAGEADEEAAEALTAEVDQEFIRHWIAYARQHHYPTLSADAKSRIKEFYTELRSKAYDTEDVPIPVTKRKLEGLTRLAQAAARVRLADEVSTEDADRACDLMLQSMQQVGVDPETGQFDADVVETGMSKNQRDRIKNVKTLIEEFESENEDGAPISKVIAKANEIGMEPEKAEQEIEKLRRKGEIYEQKEDHFRTT